MTLLSFGLEEYPYWQGVVHTVAALYIPICLVLWKMYKRVDKELEGRQTETQKQPSQMLPQLLDYEIALVCGTELSDIREKLSNAGDPAALDVDVAAALQARQRKVIGLLEPKLVKVNALLAPIAQEMIDTVKSLAADEAKEGDAPTEQEGVRKRK